MVSLDRMRHIAQGGIVLNQHSVLVVDSIWIVTRGVETLPSGGFFASVQQAMGDHTLP